MFASAPGSNAGYPSTYGSSSNNNSYANVPNPTGRSSQPPPGSVSSVMPPHPQQQPQGFSYGYNTSPHAQPHGSMHANPNAISYGGMPSKNQFSTNISNGGGYGGFSPPQQPQSQQQQQQQQGAFAGGHKNMPFFPQPHQMPLPYGYNPQASQMAPPPPQGYPLQTGAMNTPGFGQPTPPQMGMGRPFPQAMPQNIHNPAGFAGSNNGGSMNLVNPHYGSMDVGARYPQQQQQHPPMGMNMYNMPSPNAGMGRGGYGGNARRFSNHSSEHGNHNNMGGYRRGPHQHHRGGYGHGGFRQIHNNFFYNQQHHYSNNNAVPEKTPTVHVRHPTTGKVLSIKLNRIYSTMADLQEQLKYPQYCKDKERREAEKAKEAEQNREASVGKEAEKDSEKESEKEAKETETPANEKPDTAADKATEEGADADAPREPTPVPFDRTTTKLVLCLDFLTTRGCSYGSGCEKVHIAGLEYAWEAIGSEVEHREVATTKTGADGETEEVKEEETMYKSGFVVRCYDPTLTKYYNIPSESIIVSAGSTRYVTMFNEHGHNFKAKFKLCPDLMRSGTCERGAECEDIHCVLKNFSALEEKHAQRTHVNDEAAMEEVPRLPTEMQVRVYEPNSSDQVREYPGSYVLITEGAKLYQRYYEQNNHSIPQRKRMQHCAHFRLKDMCREGESCRFLHVLPTPEERAAKAAKAAEAEKQSGVDEKTLAPAPASTTEAAPAAAEEGPESASTA